MLEPPKPASRWVVHGRDRERPVALAGGEVDDQEPVLGVEQAGGVCILNGCVGDVDGYCTQPASTGVEGERSGDGFAVPAYCRVVSVTVDVRMRERIERLVHLRVACGVQFESAAMTHGGNVPGLPPCAQPRRARVAPTNP